MMKSYELYVFTQPGCPPCDRLKAHVSCLTPAQQSALHYVPLRAPNGNYTALAEELGVELTPTLVVTYEGSTVKLMQMVMKTVITQKNQSKLSLVLMKSLKNLMILLNVTPTLILLNDT